MELNANTLGGEIHNSQGWAFSSLIAGHLSPAVPLWRSQGCSNQDYNHLHSWAQPLLVPWTHSELNTFPGWRHLHVPAALTAPAHEELGGVGATKAAQVPSGLAQA